MFTFSGPTGKNARFRRELGRSWAFAPKIFGVLRRKSTACAEIFGVLRRKSRKKTSGGLHQPPLGRRGLNVFGS